MGATYVLNSTLRTRLRTCADHWPHVRRSPAARSRCGWFRQSLGPVAGVYMPLALDRICR